VLHTLCYGDTPVIVVVDDGDFLLPMRAFLPRLDIAALEPQRPLLEPDFVDLDLDRCAIQTFVIDGREHPVDTCIRGHKMPRDPGLIRQLTYGTRPRFNVTSIKHVGRCHTAR
jgi:hypothetical protein